MIKLTDAQIKHIADEVEIGMICFVHNETGEVVSFPDEMRGNEPDEEFWGEHMEKVEKEPENYTEVSGTDSRDGFSLMEDFIATIEDEKVAEKLTDSLDRPKPFFRFKLELDEHGEYKQKWYDYKEMRTIESVKRQLGMFEDEDDED